MALTIALYSGTIARGDESADTVAQVVRAWERRAAGARALRFAWQDRYTVRPGAYEGLPSKETVYENSFRFAADGDSWRVDGERILLSVKRKLLRDRFTHVWSSGEFRALTHPMEAVPYPQGAIIAETQIVEAPANDVILLPLFAALRPFHPMFTIFGKFSSRFQLVPGEHVVEGRRCILLRDQPFGSSRLALALYLDAERDFVPVQVTCDLKGKEERRTLFHEYRQADEQWVPVRWTTTFPGLTTTESTVVDFSVNGPVEPREFELEFPYGTRVSEGSEHFIVKEQGRRRWLASSDHGHGYEELLRTETGAFGPVDDRTPRRRERLGLVRSSQVRLLKGPQLFSALVGKDGDVEARIESANRPNANPRDPALCRLATSSRDELVFGKSRTADEGRVRLGQLVTRNIDRADQLCKLTPEQKRKLQVAGRGDIDRFLRRVKELAPQLERVYDEYEAQKVVLDDAVNRLIEETRPLRRLVDSGDFGPESLFAKTLKTTLTPEQGAAYEKGTASDGAKREQSGAK